MLDEFDVLNNSICAGGARTMQTIILKRMNTLFGSTRRLFRDVDADDDVDDQERPR